MVPDAALDVHQGELLRLQVVDAAAELHTFRRVPRTVLGKGRGSFLVGEA